MNRVSRWTTIQTCHDSSSGQLFEQVYLKLPINLKHTYFSHSLPIGPRLYGEMRRTSGELADAIDTLMDLLTSNESNLPQSLQRKEGHLQEGLPLS